MQAFWDIIDDMRMIFNSHITILHAQCVSSLAIASIPFWCSLDMDVKGIYVRDLFTKIGKNDMKDSKNEALFG